MMATSDPNFVFNGNYYRQRNGIAMGSALGPLFTDMDVNHLEEQYMERIKQVGVEFYKRFVDDTFTLISRNTSAETILEILNSYDENIQFTHEEKNAITP